MKFIILILLCLCTSASAQTIWNSTGSGNSWGFFSLRSNGTPPAPPTGCILVNTGVCMLANTGVKILVQ